MAANIVHKEWRCQQLVSLGPNQLIFTTQEQHILQLLRLLDSKSMLTNIVLLDMCAFGQEAVTAILEYIC